MGRLRNTSLFKRWEGNNSFVTGSGRRSNNRSWSRKSNDNIIREYKKNNKKENKTTQRVPTRGMTNRTGPPVLQDISLLGDQSNSICCTKASVDKSDTEAIRRVVEKNAFFNQSLDACVSRTPIDVRSSAPSAAKSRRKDTCSR